MAKVRSYPARELRRRRRAWMGRNVGILAVVSSGTLLLGATVSVLIAWTSEGQLQAYVLGALHVGLISVALHLVNAAFLANDSVAIHHLRGAWGEDNTRSELDRAKRKRLIWGSVDSIELRHGDIDHLVVTRRGGLVMIDSKWRNQIEERQHVSEMTRDASKAGARAAGVARHLLRRDGRAKHRDRVDPISVTPVVVVWGAARRSVPENQVVDGVHFVDGRRLISWLSSLDGHPVPEDAARDLIARLEDFRTTSGSAIS